MTRAPAGEPARLASGEDLGALRLEGLSSAGAEVVIRFPEGRLEVIRQGQEVPGYGAVLVKVLADHAVFRIEGTGVEEGGRQGQIVWMYRAIDASRPGRIKVIRLEAPTEKEPPKPIVTTPALEVTRVPPPPAG